jgi:hypothetical protein
LFTPKASSVSVLAADVDGDGAQDTNARIDCGEQGADS